MTKAIIRDNSTGEKRRYELPNSDSEFLWSDGNYGCDCNRRLFFGYAIGEKPEEINAECGEGAFSVQVYSDDGRLIFDDMK